MSETTLWGIHAGRTGDANTLFLKKKVIALGFSKVGDLSQLPPDRQAFKDRVSETFPDKKPGAIPNNAGQLYRFVHEIKPGDFAIYPSKRERQIHIGEITGPYVYDPSLDPSYPHLHLVKWLKSFPRTRFTQGALYEIGSAMSLFQVKSYAEEFLAALEGKSASSSAIEDETVSIVADEIEQTTRDFILKQLAQELKGHDFADFVAQLLGTMGYRTRVSPPGPDGGIDIIAHRDELGFEPPIIKVQVKSNEGSVGHPVVSALYGNVDHGEFGLAVTLGSFTRQALSFARGKGNLRLIDGNELVNLVLNHYEQFDSRYKGLIPMKRVYVPEVLLKSDD